MITGTLLTSRTVSSTSKPSISGIITSSRIRSGVSRSLSMACLPLNASMTWKPSCSRFMRMNRTIRSSSSTTRMRRRSNSSGISLPHKADDLFFLRALDDLDQGQSLERPDHLDHIALQVMQVLAIALAGVAHDQDGIRRLGQFLDLANDRYVAREVQDNGICHDVIPLERFQQDLEL